TTAVGGNVLVVGEHVHAVVASAIDRIERNVDVVIDSLGDHIGEPGKRGERGLDRHVAAATTCSGRTTRAAAHRRARGARGFIGTRTVRDGAVPAGHCGGRRDQQCDESKTHHGGPSSAAGGPGPSSVFKNATRSVRSRGVRLTAVSSFFPG